MNCLLQINNWSSLECEIIPERDSEKRANERSLSTTCLQGNLYKPENVDIKENASGRKRNMNSSA